MVREVLQRYGIAAHLEFRIGTRSDARYLVHGLMVTPDSARALVHAAQAEGRAVVFDYVHCTVMTGRRITVEG